MNHPKVSLIITTWLESSKKYLDLCIESVRNLNYDLDSLEVLIIGKKSYQPQYAGCKTIAPDSDQFYPAHGINFGMRHASPDSKYFFICNDDVILTQNCLTRLVDFTRENKILVNPTSPCDNGTACHLIFGFYNQKKQFVQMPHTSYTYEQLAPVAIDLMNAESLYPAGLVRQYFLCIYATLIPRIAYEAIGEWDEGFKTGQDDLDYSLRAKEKGFECVTCLDALVWHFSGVTVEKTLNPQMRRDNIMYFKNKWNFWPPGINQESFDKI